MVGRSSIRPKYEKNFEENRKKWLDAALVYSKNDPDFVKSGAITEICELSKTKRDMFHYAYRTNGEGGPYASAVVVFLANSVAREVDFIVDFTKRHPKDIFERDELVIKLLTHVSEEKNIYLIDIRRSRFELLFCLTRAIIYIYGGHLRPSTRDIFGSRSACMLCDILLKWYRSDLDKRKINSIARDIDRAVGKDGL